MANNLATERRLLTTTEMAAVNESSEFLVRARSEVQRVLADILEQRLPVSVNFTDSDVAAGTMLLAMDERAGTLLLECPAEWRANIETPGGTGVMLVCAHDEAKIQFQGGRGAIAEFEGRQVARIAMPAFIWRFQRRRDQRYAVPALKITLNLGFLESVAEVADLSTSGIGVINCDGDVNLEQDEELKDCSIALPGVGKIAVNLEVVHQTSMRTIDGATINRVGCRFTGLSNESRHLISHYVGALAGS